MELSQTLGSPASSLYNPRGIAGFDEARTQFRLLYLKPLAEEEPRIRCNLEVASLSDETSGKYEALSYVWGDQADTLPILVNGVEFRCTRSLHGALQRLAPEQGSRVLWADAICIDQTDNGERARQVQHMQWIYTNAAAVLAFLGDPFDGLDIALDYLTVAAMSDAHPNPTGHPPLRAGKSKMDARDERLGVYLIRFFALPWWNRIWTVQEYLLNDHILFHCGEFVIDSSLVAQGLDKISNHLGQCCRVPAAFIHARYPVEGCMLDFNSVCDRMLSLATQPREAGIEDIHVTLTRFIVRQATDPRDKLFGLLGLSKQFSDFVPADYTTPVEQVFEGFVLAFINHTQNLNILSSLGGDSSLSTLASWVPDWSMSTNQRWTVNGETWLQDVGLRGEMGQDKFYQTAKDTVPAWYRISPGVVRANGFVFDTIRTTVQANAFALDDPNTHPANMTAMAESFGLSDNFLRAFCGDHTWADGIPVSIAAHGQDATRSLREWYRRRSLGQEHVGDAQAFSAAALVVSSGRTFIVTERGYMGWAERRCREGDVITVLGGGPSPFVLSPVRAEDKREFDGDDRKYSHLPQYRMWGDAYLQGIMQGQAFELMGRTAGQFDELILI